MADNKTIGAGLIGYGFAGRIFHAPLLGTVDGIALKAIASSDAAKVRKDMPGMAVLADPASLIAEDGIDLIVIATPNDSHAPLARAALKAGKHVVIDKPFALDMKEARELVALAEKQQRLLSVFHNRRWDSDYLAAKFGVESGILGRVTHFESHIDRYRPDVRDRWREQDIPGAGVWYDLSPHMIDQALDLFGLPDAVEANFFFERSGARATDWVNTILSYSRHRVVLHASMLVSGGSAKFLLHGEKASLIKRGIDQQEAQAIGGMMPGAPGWGEDAEPFEIWDGTGGRRTLPTPPGDHRIYYAGIRDVILGKARPMVPAIQALAVMAVLETGIEAAASGQRIPVKLSEAEQAAYRQSRV